MEGALDWLIDQKLASGVGIKAIFSLHLEIRWLRMLDLQRRLLYFYAQRIATSNGSDCVKGGERSSPKLAGVQFI